MEKKGTPVILGREIRTSWLEDALHNATLRLSGFRNGLFGNSTGKEIKGNKPYHIEYLGNNRHPTIGSKLTV